MKLKLIAGMLTAVLLTAGITEQAQAKTRRGRCNRGCHKGYQHKHRHHNGHGHHNHHYVRHCR